jgi:hypothetical protein
MSAVSVTGHTDEIDDRDAIGVMPRAPPASGPVRARHHTANVGLFDRDPAAATR